MKKRPLSYYLSLFPITLPFVLCVAAYLLLWWKIKPIHLAKDDATAQLLFLLLKLFVIITATCVTVSFFTWFLAIFFNSWAKKSQKIQWELKRLAHASTPMLQLRLSPWFAPLLGSTEVVWRLSNDKLTSSASTHRIWAGFRPMRYIANVVWPLQDYQTYTVVQAQFYISDVFRFFRWRITLPIQQSLHNLPIAAPAQQDFTPSETTEEPVLTQKRLPRLGELFQYKNFEDNDDVRRIVWKVYAKNRELMVRTADIQYLPAIQIYLYASFYQPEKTATKFIEKQTLNRYKERLWSLIQAMEKEEIEVIWRTDQPTQATASDETHAIQWQITQCDWQDKTSIDQLVASKHKGMACVNVYTPLSTIQKILMEKKVSTVIFIPIADNYTPFTFKTIFKWLWVSDGPGNSLWKSWKNWQQQNKWYKLEQQYLQQLQEVKNVIILKEEKVDKE